MKDAVATMGAPLPVDAGGRDAVHVAVFSATSPVRVYPGQKVGAISAATEGDSIVSPVVPPAEFIGLVDPFVDDDLYPGTRFWVFLFPRTITALAHRWSHPAFEGASVTRSVAQAATTLPRADPLALYVTPTMKLESERWLRNECDVDYDTLLESVRNYKPRLGEEYLTILGSDAAGEIPPAMWGHLENVLGRRLPWGKPTYFSCSC